MGLLVMIPAGLAYPNLLCDYGITLILPFHNHWLVVRAYGVASERERETGRQTARVVCHMEYTKNFYSIVLGKGRKPIPSGNHDIAENWLKVWSCVVTLSV